MSDPENRSRKSSLFSDAGATCIFARTVLTLFLLAIAAQKARGQNLVKNPGFENFTGGTPEHWACDSSVFTVSEKASYRGDRSLKWQSNEPDEKLRCTQEIALEPGYFYEFWTHVKLEDLRGDGVRATISLEWWDGNGKRIGGRSLSGVSSEMRLRNKWSQRRLHGLSERIPDQTQRVTISLYVKGEDLEPTSAAVWFDHVGVRRAEYPVINDLSTNLYRGMATGGDVEARLVTNTKPWDSDNEQVDATLRIVNNEGDTVKTVRPYRIQDAVDIAAVLRPIEYGIPRNPNRGELRFRFDSDPLPDGDYSMVVTARTSSGKERVLDRTEFRRVEGTPDLHAWFDQHGRLIVEGEPFFPLGMYFNDMNWQDDREQVSLNEEWLDRYAESEFNTIMPYDYSNISRKHLDACSKRGLRVIFSLKDFYPGDEGKSEKEARGKLKTYVRRFRDHPAIIAWYINDEEHVYDTYEEMRQNYRLVKKLDPQRPAWSVTDQAWRLPYHLGTFDVIGTDPYPVGWAYPGMVLAHTRLTNAGLLGPRPNWQVPQAFNWSAARETDVNKFPSVNVLRSMAWQSIAAGANGLIFYAWHMMWKEDNMGLADFKSRWSVVRQVASEIKRFEPILLSTEPGRKPVAVDAPPSFAWRVFGKDGRTYLVAVNAGKRFSNPEVDPSSDAVLTFDRRISDHDVRFRDPDLSSSGRTLTINLDELEPTVIALDFEED